MRVQALRYLLATVNSFLIPILLFLLSLTSLSSPEEVFAETSFKSEDKQYEIEELEKDLMREREQFQKFGEKERTLLEELSDLEKEISEKRGNLRELQGKLGETKKTFKERETKLRHLENSTLNVEERLGNRLDVFYRYAKRGFLRTLATSAGLDQLRQRIKYLQIIMAGDSQLVREISALQKECREQISFAKDEMMEVERLEKEETKAFGSLRKDLDKRVALLMRIHKEKEFYETAVRELESAAKSLRDTLVSLERSQENRQRRDLPVDFDQSMGKLPLPVRGKIVKEGRHAGSGGQNGQKGIYIEGAAGAEVKAVFPGRVEFSGQMKGYGEMIILNHGSRYFSISARLAKRNKKEGDMVKAGEVIGFLGPSDGANPAKLYFEVRLGENPLDPGKWLKGHG
jgi:septal ring factor EnvC (AmiA/AmiB activator)